MIANTIDLPLTLICVLSLVALLAAALVGCRVGERADDPGGSSIATLQSAVLGLLALMIGFTFAMALSRFDARRDAVLQEANAIGTTALRARLLPAPQAAASLALLREYTQIRLDITRRVPLPNEMEAAIARSNEIQEQLWQQVKAVAATNTGIVPTGLYITTLNEMIDDQEKRLTAGRNRVPAIVIWSLYAVAIVAVGVTGYAVGLEKRHSRVPVYIVSVLLAAVILLIQDLDLPSTGFVQVSQQPMVDVATSLAGYGE